MTTPNRDPTPLIDLLVMKSSPSPKVSNPTSTNVGLIYWSIKSMGIGHGQVARFHARRGPFGPASSIDPELPVLF